VTTAEATSEIMSSDPKKSLPWYGLLLLTVVLVVVGTAAIVAAVTPHAASTTVSTTTGPLFDCEIDYEEWQTKWTLGQKVWCCHYYGKACPSASQEQEFDCQEGASAPGTWVADKRAYCCIHTGKGCDVTARAKASGLYDCSEKFASWEADWSVAKKLWCCENGAGTCPQRRLK